MPGNTAHAISTTRGDAVADEVGCDEPSANVREATTERMIANWATVQHATAIQKIASARE